MNTKQNWVATYGHAEISGNEITHIPTKQLSSAPVTATSAEQKIFPPHTTLRSNIEFEQGSISWEVFLDGGAGTCVILLPADPSSPQSSGSVANATELTTDFELALGVNCLGAPYGIAALRNFNWEPVLGAGHGSAVPIHKWVGISVRAVGSSIELYVENVRVLSVTRTLKRGQIGLFMQGDVQVKFRNLRIDSQKPLCFIVMQFSADFNILYSDVIRPLCEEYGYNVVRGDDFHTSGQILEDITQSIINAALIIADVTPDNPNVFYEVGYAHGLGKPTILLSDRSRERLPFDISGFRTLFYDNTIGGKAIVEQRLRQHLDALRAR